MDGFLSFFTDPGPWSWLVLAAVLFGGEVLTGTTYLLWVAVAAVVMAALVALVPGLGLAPQLVSFAGFALAATLAGRRFFPPDETSGAHGPAALNQPQDRMIGARATAVAAFVAGEGRVRIGDSEWRAVAQPGLDIPEGMALEVTSVDGATVAVRPPGSTRPTSAG